MKKATKSTNWCHSLDWVCQWHYTTRQQGAEILPYAEKRLWSSGSGRARTESGIVYKQHKGRSGSLGSRTRRLVGTIIYQRTRGRDNLSGVYKWTYRWHFESKNSESGIYIIRWQHLRIECANLVSVHCYSRAKWLNLNSNCSLHFMKSRKAPELHFRLSIGSNTTKLHFCILT